jgi:hypothetical protein
MLVSNNIRTILFDDSEEGNMAGRPHGKAPRTVRIALRMTEEGAAALDRKRGGVNRSTYIRALIMNDIYPQEKKK